MIGAMVSMVSDGLGLGGRGYGVSGVWAGVVGLWRLWCLMVWTWVVEVPVSIVPARLDLGRFMGLCACGITLYYGLSDGRRSLANQCTAPGARICKLSQDVAGGAARSAAFPHCKQRPGSHILANHTRALVSGAR